MPETTKLNNTAGYLDFILYPFTASNVSGVYLRILTSLLFLCFMVGQSCNPPPEKALAATFEVQEKLIWVYTHSIGTGAEYTVFSTEEPINKAILPNNFLAIKNGKQNNWHCLLKWEGDVLWFYTPSSRFFASHNSENGKTQWTIIEEEDFNYFFYEDKDPGFIRFSSHCGEPEVLCLDVEELVIGE